MENLMPDSAINIFTKKKAMEILGSLLEMRTNLYGYATPPSVHALSLVNALGSGWLCDEDSNCINIFCRSKELKCPDLVAEHYKPFICRLQQWIFKHAFVTSMLFVLVRLCKGFMFN